MQCLDDILFSENAQHARTGVNDDGQSRAHIPIVHIQSPEQAVGQTQLLFYLTALAIIPSSINDVFVGGQEGAVVFLDTDGHFDASRLHSIVTRTILDRASHSTIIDEEKASEMATLALDHVHVFRPESSRSLLSTLSSIASFLFNIDSHYQLQSDIDTGSDAKTLSNRPLRALILDSASSFYSEDRYEQVLEQLSSEAADSPSSESSISSIHEEITSHLRELSSKFQCPVYFTTWSLPTRNIPPTSQNQQLRQEAQQGPRLYLSPPWFLLSNLKIQIEQFVSGNENEDGDGRTKDVRLRIVGWKRQGWSEDVIARLVEAGKRIDGIGRMKIDAEGVKLLGLNNLPAKSDAADETEGKIGGVGSAQEELECAKEIAEEQRSLYADDISS